MKKLLFYLLLACFSLPALAQEDRAEIKKQINKIKKSQAYVSAEATMPTEAEAMEMANQLLVFEINNWLQSKRKSNHQFLQRDARHETGHASTCFCVCEEKGYRAD